MAERHVKVWDDHEAGRVRVQEFNNPEGDQFLLFTPSEARWLAKQLEHYASFPSNHLVECDFCESRNHG